MSLDLRIHSIPYSLNMIPVLWRQMAQHIAVPVVLCGKPQQAAISDLCRPEGWVGSSQESAFQANGPDSSTRIGQRSWQCPCHFATAPGTTGTDCQVSSWSPDPPKPTSFLDTAQAVSCRLPTTVARVVTWDLR
jgi:hypothetical protein